MKRTFTALMSVVFFGPCGCVDVSKPEGTEATRSSAKRPASGETEDTFVLTVPRLSTSLPQGENKHVEIGIVRGKNFDGDVTLKVTRRPEGVTTESPGPIIRHGDTSAKLMLKAADDAALGDYTVVVTGHPARGADATADLKIAVVQKSPEPR
jgi:hypothetical protein